MNHSIGTTTWALALTNFMNHKLGIKTAYLELNGTNEISSLSNKGNEKSFSYCGFTIFPSLTLADLDSIYGLSYHCFVLDMGILNPHTSSTFWRSDLCLIICNFAPWQERNRKNFMEKLLLNKKENQKKATILAVGEISKRIPNFSKQDFRNVVSLPYLSNPFRLTPKDWIFFEQMMKEFLYYNIGGITYDQ